MRDLLVPAYVKAFHSVNGKQFQRFQYSIDNPVLTDS
jgi:hypothetical protein